MSRRPEYDIETAEYETERSVFDMWRWINGHLDAMERAGIPVGNYLMRRGENIKKLVEEAIPVASLGLSLFGPGNEVYVRCLAGNQPYDASLRVTGYSRMEIKVEVTTNQDEESVLARQLLSRQGFTHRPVKYEDKEGGKIAPPEMVDMDEEWERWIDLALERAMTKVRTGSYGPDTAILVLIDTYGRLPLRSRADLVCKTRDRLEAEKNKVYGVYYFHSINRVRAIDEVRMRTA